jgi:hypothetical protein
MKNYRMLIYGDLYDDYARKFVEDERLLYDKVYEDCIPDITDIDPNYNNLVIIDDTKSNSDKMNIMNIREIVCSARHRNCSVIYIMPLYSMIDQVIKNNFDRYLLCDIDEKLKHIGDPIKRDLKHIHYYSGLDIDLNEFITLCKSSNTISINLSNKSMKAII